MKRQIKNKVVKTKMKFEDKEILLAEMDLAGSEPIKPLVLQVVINNGSDVVLQDIISGYMYALEKKLSEDNRSYKYQLVVLGIQ